MLVQPSTIFAPNFNLICQIVYKLQQFIYQQLFTLLRFLKCLILLNEEVALNFVKNEINATETFKMIQKAFGDESLSRKTVFQWWKKFIKFNQKSKFCLLFLWIIEMLCIMNLFQKVEQLIKNTICKLYIVCMKPFIKKDRIYGQTIHGFYTTITHLLIMQSLFVNFSPKIQLILLTSPVFSWYVTMRLFPIWLIKKTSSRNPIWLSQIDKTKIEGGPDGNSKNWIRKVFPRLD